MICAVPGISYGGSRDGWCFDRQAISRFQIVMTGYAGRHEASAAVLENIDKFEERFSEHYIRKMTECARTDDGAGDVFEAINSSILVNAVFPAEDGGIYGALWQICEEAKCGLRVDIKKIPIKQETVEACNILDTDPYSLPDEDVYLIVTSNAEGLMLELAAEGVDAAHIGYLTDELARVIVIGENERFLNRPETYLPERSHDESS